MLLEKDINILEEGLFYINSKGNRVKKFPQVCLGGVYILEAAYRCFSYGTIQYISSTNIKNKAKIKEAREIVLAKVIKELTV